MSTKKLESKYKKELKGRIEDKIPTCNIFDLDPQQYQGIADLLILYKNTWGMLEVKRDAKSSFRPNQKYVIDKFNRRGFCSAISPEVEEKVLKSLIEWFDFNDIFDVRKHWGVLKNE